MSSESLSFETSGAPSTAFVEVPASGNGKAVLVIQEYWGLNDHIKDIASRYAAEGFIAVAPDLYRGNVATDPREAGEMMQALALDDGIDIIGKAMDGARE